MTHLWLYSSMMRKYPHRPPIRQRVLDEVVAPDLLAACGIPPHPLQQLDPAPLATAPGCQQAVPAAQQCCPLRVDRLAVDQPQQCGDLPVAGFLNFGSTIFTPIYSAVIPEVVTPTQYPGAVAIGSISYVLGPSLGAFVIAAVGFRGNFFVDGITFIISALLLLGLPRLGAEMIADSQKAKVSAGHKISAMLRRLPLRTSLYLALQSSATEPSASWRPSTS